MNTLLLMLSLLAAPENLASPPDGSILFVENGNVIVQSQTDSTVTHVGVIVNIDGVPWLYEAVKPVVRRIKLSDYYNQTVEENKTRRRPYAVWIATPNTPFVAKQTRALKEYLDSKLGTKYSLRSFVNGIPSEGIHCCELTGMALRAAGIDYSDNPCKDGPFDVWTKTKPFYKNREEIILK
jgi:hypothetical protein